MKTGGEVGVKSVEVEVRNILKINNFGNQKPVPSTLHRCALNASLGIAMITLPLVGHAQIMSCKGASPTQTQALVEVFTSEGCSSCPPADRWLSALAQVPPQKLMTVALSMHVDYWDYIGWKDPFAKAAYTQRQYVYARQRGVSGVYTPQVVLGGRDFPKWDASTTFLQAVKQINDRPARAHIELDAKAAKLGGDVHVYFNASTEQSAQLHLVLFENSLKSKVNAGENRGELLGHDRVAREFVKLDSKVGQTNLPLAKGQRVELSGLAAFLQTANGEVLQAVACEFKP
jgi:hypothetical protein